MKVEIKKISGLKRMIKIEVGKVSLLEKKKEIYHQLGKTLKVPGFRPGNAPLEVLERHHRQFLKEEFLKRVLPFYYQEVIKKNDFKVAGLPRIFDVELSDESLSFCAEFEIEPEVKIDDKDYQKIKIKSKKVEVEEIEIEKVLTNLKENIKKVTNKDLDDQNLARWLGYPDLDDLREAIRGEIFVEKLGTRRRDLENQIVQHLLKRVKIEAPKKIVEDYHRRLVERKIYHLRLRGISEDDIEKYKKDLEEKLEPVAEDSIKLSYILKAIAEKEGIKVDNDLEEIVLGFILSCAEYV
ncbi:MAG TPA: hypothetical protein EYP89_04025 [Candidatus Omnitrophica bacterium]|nr:hypothetical protein [Candidatus Omnitrophota bacterium]